MYKKRQGIVERPFGIIKRQLDCSYTLLRGLEKVNGEFAIVFTSYNIRRAITILGVKSLLDKLKIVKIPCFNMFYPFFIAYLRRHTLLSPHTHLNFAQLRTKLFVSQVKVVGAFIA